MYLINQDCLVLPNNTFSSEAINVRPNIGLIQLFASDFILCEFFHFFKSSTYHIIHYLGKILWFSSSLSLLFLTLPLKYPSAISSYSLSSELFSSSDSSILVLFSLNFLIFNSVCSLILLLSYCIAFQKSPFLCPSYGPDFTSIHQNAPHIWCVQ